jgi:hypothetical protein
MQGGKDEILCIRDGVGSVSVYLNKKILNPRYSQTVMNHSPDGFEWGYEGSGPAQLALAILLEKFGREKALTHYQHFKREFIATWQKDKIDVLIDISGWMAERNSDGN